MLEERVRELKGIISGADGRNAADARFARAVDELVSAVYDDIGEIKRLPTRALFDLFVIKVLYVGRQSSDAGVLDYLGQLLESRLDASELFPPDDDGRPRRMYFSEMLDPNMRGRYQNMFEAWRGYADNALFMTGMFPQSMQPRRAAPGAMRRRPSRRGIDAGYYVSTGKAMYRMAARHELAEDTQQRDTLEKLGRYFELYADALNEMSERYIMGFDMELIADKMLDNFNRYRESGDEAYLTNARRYAAILRLDRERFPSLFGEAGA